MVHHRQSFCLYKSFLINWKARSLSFQFVFGVHKGLLVLSQSITSATYLINNIFFKDRSVQEKKHHVCDLESTETIKCSAPVKSQPFLRNNILWYNGITGDEIKSGRRITLNGPFLKINNVQLDDAGTYECRTASSSRFYTIYVNSEYFFSTCHFSVNFVKPNPNPSLTTYI